MNKQTTTRKGVTRQLTFRLDEDLAEEIETYRLKLESEAPGLSITTSAAARVLIRMGLNAVAKEGAQG